MQGLNPDEVIHDELTKLSQTLVDRIRKNLESKGEYYRRSTLAQEIVFLPVKQVDGGYKITIQMPDYAPFIDKGVKGAKTIFSAPDSPYSYKSKKPPVESLILWIKKRGDIPVKIREIKLKNKTVRKAVRQMTYDKKIRSMAFAMSEGVRRKGIKSTHFYSEIMDNDTLNELFRAMIPQLGEAYTAEIVSDDNS